MIRIKEVILVEGRYDKIAVSSIFDTVIFETSGFSIFNDSQKQRLIRDAAEKRGLIVLTDPDSAGFVIRNFVKGICDANTIKNAYIPSVEGKEKRKSKRSAENILGVEGTEAEKIREAVLRVCTLVDADNNAYPSVKITAADLYRIGLSGKKESSAKRTELLKKMDYPQNISGKAFLDIMNTLYTRDEFMKFIGAEID